MAKEIEKRFLVTHRQFYFREHEYNPWQITQGYFDLLAPSKSLRVRITNGTNAEITAKIGWGTERNEISHRVSIEFGKELLSLAHYKFEKTRFKKKGWELDFFKGPLSGIILAEYELPKLYPFISLPDELPDWIGEGFDITDTLTNLHLARLATFLGNSGETDALPLLLKRLQRKIKKIALTGPPCSGKSTIIEILKKEMPEVKFMPELATILLGEVGLRPGNDPAGARCFQQTIYRTSHILESTSAEICPEENKIALVTDRGKVDIAAYLRTGINEFTELVNSSIEAEYGEYDAVIYLDIPPQEVFEREKSNNPHRMEKDYNEIWSLAERTRTAWEGHPYFIFVPNGEKWEDKVAAVRRAIQSIISN